MLIKICTDIMTSIHINKIKTIIMQYLLLAFVFLFFAVVIGYLVDHRRYLKVKRESDEIDKELERVRTSTEKLILSTYDELMSKQEGENLNKLIKIKHNNIKEINVKNLKISDILINLGEVLEIKNHSTFYSIIIFRNNEKQVFKFLDEQILFIKQ